MRIVVDMDEVICRWADRVLEWYNEDKGTSVTREQITRWKVSSCLPHSGNDFIRSCMRYPEFYRDLDPVEGAIAGMRRLIGMGHDVVIATAVPKCAGIAYHGKLEWIRRNMPFFDLDSFVAIHRKDILQGDVLLDDGIHNVHPWSMTGRHAFLMDAPWNRDCPRSSFITRVVHWNEFISHVKRLAREGDEA